jgi:hypothetical protein
MIVMFISSDTLVRLMVGMSRVNKEDPFGEVGEGWKNDIPLLVYCHIVVSFLHEVQAQMAIAPDFNAADFIGESGYHPFSDEEWNDAIAEVYVKFVTDGHANVQAIVFDTTPTRQNRNRGKYYIFQYNRNELASIPFPAPTENVVATGVDGRGFRDSFWPDLCKVGHPSRQDSSLTFYISLWAILVGSLLLQVEPNLLHHMVRRQN